jgi:hypothetical protein
VLRSGDLAQAVRASFAIDFTPSQVASLVQLGYDQASQAMRATRAGDFRPLLRRAWRPCRPSWARSLRRHHRG